MSDDGGSHDEYLHAQHDLRMGQLGEALDVLLALLDERVHDPEIVMAAATVHGLRDLFSI